MATGSPDSKRSDDSQDMTEFVGAPTEFADVDEVPEWVANVAKVLFFLPTALLTVSTLPFALLGVALFVCLCLMVFGAVVGAL